MNTSMQRTLRLCLGTTALAGLIFVGALGCSSSTRGGTVTGTVHYGDKNLGNMTEINLHPVAGGNPFKGGVAPDGKYQVIDVPPGDYKVTVSSVKMPGGMQMPNLPGGKMPGMNKEQLEAQMKAKGVDPKDLDLDKAAGEGLPTFVQLPPKYADVKSTPLTVTVVKGKNEGKDFDLTD